MVEREDTEDLKSSGARAPCGFESRSGYQPSLRVPDEPARYPQNGQMRGINRTEVSQKSRLRGKPIFR